MNVVTVADLANEAGRANARGIVEWADHTIHALHEVFHDAPEPISELAFPLGLTLTELAGAVNATLDSITLTKAITPDVVDQHNRASALQRAALALLNHIQRHATADIRTVAPPPTHQLGHECVCGRKHDDTPVHPHTHAKPELLH